MHKLPHQIIKKTQILKIKNGTSITKFENQRLKHIKRKVCNPHILELVHTFSYMKFDELNLIYGYMYFKLSLV